MIFLSSFPTRKEAGRLGDHVLGCSERFYWLSQMHRELDSAVATGVLHPRRVASVIRGQKRSRSGKSLHFFVSSHV